MALHDPKSQVRVQAIQTIQAREKEQGESIFRECLKDSSYAVVSASLDALFNELPLRDSVEKMQIAAKFENYDNSYEVLNELISLYGKYAGPDKLPFFHKLPYILADKHLGSFLSAYKKILMKSNAQLLKSELPFIAKINHKMTSFWELMSYKSLLSDFANALHDNKLPNGGLSSSEMKSLQTRVQTMADEVDLKNFGY